MRSNLFDASNQERQTNDRWALQSSKMLRCALNPQAAVCWSANLQPQIKNDFKMGSLIGRGSGESFQLGFHGPGFVVVQPSEGAPVVAAS